MCFRTASKNCLLDSGSLEGRFVLPQATPGFRFKAAVLADLQFVGQSPPSQIGADVLWRHPKALAPRPSQLVEAETVQTGDLGLQRFLAIRSHGTTDQPLIR